MARKCTPLAKRWKVQVAFGEPNECWEWIGCKSIKGYGYFSLGGDASPSALAHRVGYELLVGPIEPGLVIDHICHNRGCVNPAHLRQVTSAANNFYRKGANASSTSGYRGVSYSKVSRGWMAYASKNYKRYIAGYFSTPEEANKAAIALRRQLSTTPTADLQQAA